MASSSLGTYFWLLPLIESAEQTAVSSANEEERADDDADQTQSFQSLGSIASILSNVRWQLVRALDRISNDILMPRYQSVPSYRAMIAYGRRQTTLLLAVNDHYTMSRSLGGRGLATDPSLSSKLGDIEEEMGSDDPSWRTCIDDIRSLPQNHPGSGT